MSDRGIATEPASACVACGASGRTLHRELRDELFDAPGHWTLRRCPNDGLLWLDPRPRPGEFDKVYGSYHTHGAAEPGNPERIARAWRDLSGALAEAAFGYKTLPRLGALRLLARFPLVRDLTGAEVMWMDAPSSGALLDVGSGQGRFLARMSRLGWRALGVEPDEAAARAARRDFGVDVVSGGLERFADQGDARFDAITLNNVLEHVPDPVQTLVDCWRLLRARGTLALITPNADSLGHRLFGRAWRGLEPPRHLHIFTRRSLEAVADRAGLRPARVRTVWRAAPFIWLSSRGLRARERHEVGAGTRPLALDLAAAVGFTFLELMIFPHGGEELLLLAQKATPAHHRTTAKLNFL